MGHIHKLYDFTVSSLIVHDSKVLILRHKRYTDLWLLPGGHIELNETPIDALYREIAEEVGIHKHDLRLIELKPTLPTGDHSVSLPLPFDLNVHKTDGDHKHIDLCYVLSSNTDKVHPGEGESQEWQWMNEFEIEDFAAIPPDTKLKILAGLHFALEQAE